MKKAGTTVLIGLAAPGLLILGFVIAIPLLFGGGENCRPLAPIAIVNRAAAQLGQWDAEQVTNARTIVEAGAQLGVPPRGQVIAVMTAMAESSLRNKATGDLVGPDSRGLFQQRANGAWGSEADRMTPAIASSNFYRALLAVPGWDQLQPSYAAHKVQRNADPYVYEKWWGEAEQLVADAGGLPADQASGIGVTCVTDLSNASWEGAEDCAFEGFTNPRSCREALAWATQVAEESACTSDLPGGTWRRWCLAFVAKAYGYRFAGEPTAKAMYNTLKAEGLVSTSTEIPAGALVFFDSSDPAGHVALYAGDGQAFSNDYVRKGCIDLTPMDRMGGNGQYLGWAPPHFPKAG